MFFGSLKLVERCFFHGCIKPKQGLPCICDSCEWCKNFNGDHYLKHNVKLHRDAKKRWLTTDDCLLLMSLMLGKCMSWQQCSAVCDTSDQQRDVSCKIYGVSAVWDCFWRFLHGLVIILYYVTGNLLNIVISDIVIYDIVLYDIVIYDIVISDIVIYDIWYRDIWVTQMPV